MQETQNEPQAKQALLPREILRAELVKRTEKNPQYSLRAFARSAGVSHTLLSLVLSGKRPMSRKTAEHLATVLGLENEVREQFVNSPENTLGHLAVSGSRKDSTSMRQLSLDQFALVSEWYHYAILSLLDIPGSKLEPRWISERLRISPTQARSAISRLIRLGFVEMAPDGSWKQSGKPFRVDNSISTSATRKFHKQLLKKAMVSLERDPFDSRCFLSTTFTLDPSLVPLLKERLNDLRRALITEAEKLGNPASVYNLTIQLFPVTPPESVASDKIPSDSSEQH